MRRLKRNIHVRMALVIAVGAATIAVLSSAIWYKYDFHKELENSKHAIEQLVKAVEKTAAAAVYVNSDVLAGEVLNGLAANDLVLYASLESVTGFRAETAANRELDKQSYEFLLNHPFSPSEALGKLIVQPDRNVIEQRATAIAEQRALHTILHSLAIAFLVFLLVNRALTQPLKSTAEQLHDIKPGDTGRLNCPSSHEEDEIGALVGDINTLLDSAERHIEIERNMRQKSEALEKKFRLIYEEASAGICLINKHNHLVTSNPAFIRLIDPMLSMRDSTSPQCSFPDNFTDASYVEDLLNELRIDAEQPVANFDLELKFGEQHWIHCLFTKVVDDDGEVFIEGILYDVTTRMRRELDARFEADHDPLTGLKNRRSSEREIRHAMFNAANNGNSIAILLIDLDKFKPINDTHGHDAGDIVLKEVARRLQSVFRSTDIITRWGGDEFLVAFEQSVFDVDLVSKVCDMVLHHFREPFHLGGNFRCSITGSIGVSIFPDDSDELETLIEHADTAMYRVKASGRDTFAIYKAQWKNVHK